ncbi:MAG: quinolinate synthase [Bacteroidetes bacterium HGW-Bacteroidetes-6]|jgi:quinolinate synthase|nr:MAG: quinolinate synthase [Bacteroidetes bacterium HGW-Bacteroidetes-6]
MKKNIINNINRLKTEKNAVILAHYYQIPEIQELADFVGDSLALAQAAVKIEADIIVFAGVHFMAETAKILNPNKKVLIPDMNAGCSLADSCPADEFELFLKDYKDHIVLTYVNASARVKTLSDIIVTSSNALKIVEQLPENEKIVFAPDRNLGSYINAKTGRNMVLWNGSCHVHDQLSIENVINLKLKNPDFKLIAHPECKSPVLELADFIGSTQALLNYTKTDASQKYIVATEGGIIHQMQKASPQKEFIVVPVDENCNCNDCIYMKMNTLEKIEQVLETESNEIFLDDQIISAAIKPLKRMLEMS